MWRIFALALQVLAAAAWGPRRFAFLVPPRARAAPTFAAASPSWEALPPPKSQLQNIIPCE